MTAHHTLRILLTNDDGIYAPGLETLERIAREISDDLWVVAPETEQSGAAHSLSLNNPLRFRQLTPQRFAVSGTPTDCVVMAVRKLVTGKPVDLILSGVNRGSNLGEDITYSGTVAAAMEGTLLNIPSIAFSQCYTDMQRIRWEVAERHGAPLIRHLLECGWPEHVLINVNFPDMEAESVLGVRIAPQGKRHLDERLTECVDPKGRPYYWMDTIQGEDRQPETPGSDIALAEAGHITVTPVCIDFTDYRALESLRAKLEHDNIAGAA